MIYKLNIIACINIRNYQYGFVISLPLKSSSSYALSTITCFTHLVSPSYIDIILPFGKDPDLQRREAPCICDYLISTGSSSA